MLLSEQGIDFIQAMMPNSSQQQQQQGMDYKKAYKAQVQENLRLRRLLLQADIDDAGIEDKDVLSCFSSKVDNMGNEFSTPPVSPAGSNLDSNLDSDFLGDLKDEDLEDMLASS